MKNRYKVISNDYINFVMNLLRFKTSLSIDEKKEIAIAFYEAEIEIADGCIDNHRFICDESDELKYNKQIEEGCCGFYDKKITLSNGKEITIGFNYGH
ncbi:MAG: hypothetical protein M0R46_13305 [Candidatus Muirbacterium halophilum]|nr:hypothetical protein [Candidatus Muirbacterium halophilum]